VHTGRVVLCYPVLLGVTAGLAGSLFMRVRR
jgi:hypothetical protein